MTGSRARLLALVLIAASATGPARAQESAPTLLQPRDRAAQPAETKRQSRQGVEINTLGAPDVSGLGMLNAETGGLKPDLWLGTSRTRAEILMGALSGVTGSATLRDLVRRAFLSSAAAPKGRGSGMEWVERRVRTLLAMGDLDAAKSLLGAIPATQQSQAASRIKVDMSLMSSPADACAVAAAEVAKSADPFWQKMVAFCQALDGEHAKAALSASLLRELGHKDDAFFVLLDAMAGNKGALPPLPNPAPLHLAMARAAKVALPKETLEKGGPFALRAALGASEGEAGIEAAERAAAANVLSAEALGRAYAAQPFDKRDLGGAISKSKGLPSPMARALLFQAAGNELAPEASRAGAAAIALDLARKEGRFTAVARAVAPSLAKMRPSTDMDWFAPEAIRALLASGAVDKAAPWFELLRSRATTDPKAAADRQALLPLARLAGMEAASGWTTAELDGWWRKVVAEPGARDRAAMLYTLLDAMGDATPAPLWTALAAGPSHAEASTPHPSIWHMLAEAGKHKRLGETILLGFVVLQNGGEGGLDPIAVGRVIRALRANGMTVEARALAIEAAVAAGL